MGPAASGALASPRLHRADVEDLAIPAAVPVDGDASFTQAGKPTYKPPGRLNGGVVGEVDGFGDSVVGVALESRLHLHVIGGEMSWEQTNTSLMS